MDVILVGVGLTESQLELLRELEKLSSMEMEPAMENDDFLDVEDYEFYNGHYDWWDVCERGEN